MILRYQHRVIIAIIAVLLVSVYAFGFQAAEPTSAQEFESVCYVFVSSLTNNTVTNQGATVQFLSPSTFQPISAAATIGLAPGETGFLTLAAFIRLPDAPPILGGGPGALTVNSLSFGPASDADCGGRLLPIQREDPDGDIDGDGIPNKADNCVFVYNPGQENGWGDPFLGDACDPNFYDNRDGVKAFQLLLDGSFVVYSACHAEPIVGTVCYPVGRFDPLELAGAGEATFSEGLAEWYITIYQIGTQGNVTIYQVNTYNAGLLKDDRLLVLVNRNGVVTWRHR